MPAPTNEGFGVPEAPQSFDIVLVSHVGEARGSGAAAAALACVGSSPDRAALLIELDDGAAPRPSLIATAAARELEERLAAHLPAAGVASRGPICRLRLSPDGGAVEAIPAALPLVRGGVAVVHLPPDLLQPLLAEGRIGATGLLLRADLAADRPLAALAVRAALERDLRVAVLKRPLGWLAAQRALLGAVPPGAAILPPRIGERLLGSP